MCTGMLEIERDREMESLRRPNPLSLVSLRFDRRSKSVSESEGMTRTTDNGAEAMQMVTEAMRMVTMTLHN
jgi:hypothetical protein